MRAREIGSSDCEELQGGLLTQPVNALSSLAYVVAGAALGWWARRHPGIHRITLWVMVGCLVLAGVGSVDYHGTQTPVALWGHDAGAVLVLVALASHAAAQAGTGSDRAFLAFFVPSAVVVSAVLAAVPEAGPPLGVVAAAVFGVLEVLRARRRPWWALSPGLRRRSFVALACLVAGGLLHATSRTGGPLCDADTLLQGHAAWHLLSAAGLGLLCSIVLERDAALRPAALPAPPP